MELANSRDNRYVLFPAIDYSDLVPSSCNVILTLFSSRRWEVFNLETKKIERCERFSDRFSVL